MRKCKRYSEDFCKKNNIQCILKKVDVLPFADLEKMTIEESARFLRYQAIEEEIENRQIDCVCLAHHMDDQAETILMHILRGSGLKGAMGMSPKSGFYIRPLLCVKRSEVDEFAEKNKYIIINVNQGYSACSTLVVDKKTVITADIGIKRALEKENIEVHLICAKEIKLPGYDCGFIGGSGVVIGDTLYTFGSISNLSDAVKIENALTVKNIKIKEIIPDDVCDFGGVKIF